MAIINVVATAVQEGETLRELPVPPAAIGLLTIAFFGLLLLVTYAFRSVGTRH